MCKSPLLDMHNRKKKVASLYIMWFLDSDFKITASKPPFSMQK